MAKNSFYILSFGFTFSTLNFKLPSSRTLYKSALFMQNKPNLLETEMNVSSVLTKHYENQPLCERRQNKPNQTQFQNRYGNGTISFSWPPDSPCRLAHIAAAKRIPIKNTAQVACKKHIDIKLYSFYATRLIITAILILFVGDN